MAGGGVRGFVFGALGLIALDSVLSHADKTSGLLGTLTGLLDRAVDPSVPAIPDHSSSSASSSKPGTVGNGSGAANGAGVLDPSLANLPTAAQIITAQRGAEGAAGGNAVAALEGPNGLFYNPQSLSQYVAGFTSPTSTRNMN